MTGSGPATTGSDVFSFAVILLGAVMAKSAREIGESKDSLHQLHFKGERFEIPSRVIQDHPRVCALIQRCWSQDVGHRPTFVDIAKEMSASGTDSRRGLSMPRSEEELEFHHHRRASSNLLDLSESSALGDFRVVSKRLSSISELPKVK